jgi:hypothetical protein
MNVVQIFSLIGAGLILLAFYKVTQEKWKPTSSIALITNAVGAGILLVTATIERQYGFIILEFVWTAVSLWGLVKPKA